LRELKAAFAALGKQTVTDDCQAVEMNGGQVKLFEVLKPNFKITTVEDLQVAGALLK
jgi:2-C-methyl-D-erythritol 4-phosphate cytidylyltransferase